MKRFKLSDLGSDGPQHVAHKLAPGVFIDHGGLSFHPVGWRTHPEGQHMHDNEEIFCILQGQGEIEIDGRREPVHAGDVLVIEPGEDHHLVGDPAHPIINCWFHCADEPHLAQRPA